MRSVGLSIFQLGVVCPTNLQLLSIFNQRRIAQRNMPIAISTMYMSSVENGNNGGATDVGHLDSSRMSGEVATSATAAVTINSEIDLYKVCFTSFSKVFECTFDGDLVKIVGL